MFTGLVEELGVVSAVRFGLDSAVLVIRAVEVLKDAEIGDSIAVNGVCLTVTGLRDGEFSADVMAETLKRTNLGKLRPGDRVNLERALRLGDRLGGHLVSGHIDGVGTIIRQERHGIATVTTITAPPEVMRYIIKKGSVAVDGVSLTVVDFDHNSFRVSLIPHTAGATTLGYKGVGDLVNLEGDLIGKYVEKFMSNGNEEKRRGITLELLAEKGFI